MSLPVPGPVDEAEGPRSLHRSLGLGLSAFSATLATIYQFKPQGIALSATFLCVISYVLALALERIPRWGALGRWLNPHPFNSKEHTAILIMSSTAAHSAMAVEVIAVQRLWVHLDAECSSLHLSDLCVANPWIWHRRRDARDLGISHEGEYLSIEKGSDSMRFLGS